MTITTVLFDLDGVVRHFDPNNVREIEQRHGIPLGSIERFAFAAPLIDEVTTGRISRAEWTDRLAAHLHNVDAAEEWSRQPYRLDTAILDLADRLRSAGLTTAILTNGTDTIAAEARTMRLHDHFDAVFNSAEIGYAKPDARAFRAVLDALDVRSNEVFFTDDSAAKLAGAEGLGISSHLFTDAEGLCEALQAHGIPASSEGISRRA